MSIKVDRGINKEAFLDWLRSFELEPEQLSDWEKVTEVLEQERLIEIYEYLKQYPNDLPVVTKHLQQKIQLAQKTFDSQS